MFGPVLGKASDYFGQRFFLVALYPALATWTAVVVLLAGRVGWRDSLAWWQQRGQDGSRVWIILAVIVGLLVFAGFLVYLASAIVRLYEGHWQARRGLGWLAAVGRWRQQAWYQRLCDRGEATFDTRFRFFLAQEEELEGETLLPTRLGNALRSAEAYPLNPQRYAMDAVLFWPRLYAVVPDAMRATLTEARGAVDAMLTLSLLAWLYVPVAFAILLTSGAGRHDWWQWLAALGGGALVGWGAYRNAVRAAGTFGELVRASFDLYRHDLLKQLGFAIPGSLEDEQRLWHNLGQQLVRLGADDEGVLRYANADEPKNAGLRLPKSAWVTAGLVASGWAAGVVAHALGYRSAQRHQRSSSRHDSDAPDGSMDERRKAL